MFLLAHFDSFFNNNLFSNFINKCQKEILRCATFFTSVWFLHLLTFNNIQITEKPLMPVTVCLEEKKKKLLPVIFSKISYVGCTINCTGKLTCLCVCLHEHDDTGLIDKSEAWAIVILMCVFFFLNLCMSNTFGSTFMHTEFSKQ